jgi:hypothetical protein
MVLFTGVSMETSGWKSVYRASGTASRLILTIALFTHGASASLIDLELSENLSRGALQVFQ